MRKLSFCLPMLMVFAACGGISAAVPQERAPRALVILAGGIDWVDIRSSGAPALTSLISRGASANVAVRVTNRPADAYATLGAGRRIQAIPSAGWAFDSEESVENGTGADLYMRRTGKVPTGAVVAPAIDQLVRGNVDRAFGGRPGALGAAAASAGKTVVVIGNADRSASALGSILPDQQVMSERDPPQIGISREVALVGMDEQGQVATGAVGRHLVEPDASTPFGVKTSRAALIEEFERLRPGADLMVVELGDTRRADAYSATMDADDAANVRRQAVRRVDALVADLVARVGNDTLVIFLAPTSPGGDEARGRLRPVVISGAGYGQGTLTSSSTRRRGIVTMPDITATVVRSLGLGGERFGSGRATGVIPGRPDLAALARRDASSHLHDEARLPFAILAGATMIILLTLILRKVRPPSWLLLAVLTLPLSSFVTKLLPHGSPAPISILVVVATAIVLGWGASKLGHDGPVAVFGATFVFYVVDLAVGAPAQLDSLLGYTSVAAGRYFGLGNLGFAAFALASLAVAGRWRERGPKGRLLGSALLVLALIVIAHPRLGDDVGGMLAMAVAFGYWMLSGSGGPGAKRLILVLATTTLVLGASGWLDLMRPASERTHLGDFLANVWADPFELWLVVRRKALLAVTSGINNPWTPVLPFAAAVLVKARSSMSTGPVVLAAIVGAFLNDSGFAVAGVMLGLAAIATAHQEALSSGWSGSSESQPAH